LFFVAAYEKGTDSRKNSTERIKFGFLHHDDGSISVARTIGTTPPKKN